MNAVLKLVFAIGISELAGVAGSFFTAPAIVSPWYTALQKPALNPPNWVFGPVWTILFALMGVALFLVWQQHSLIRSNERMLRMWRLAFFVFAFQLTLNIFWSVLFFGLQNPAAAGIEIISLWLSIVATTMVFWKISRAAAWLLVPYILWVSFAVYLNYAIWALN